MSGRGARVRSCSARSAPDLHERIAAETQTLKEEKKMRVWKRTKHYWYEFTFEGRRVRASSKQGDKEAAKNIGAANRTRLAQGKFDLNKPKRVTINELLDRVRKNYELKGQLS